MLTHILTQDGEIIETTTNVYGDQEMTSSETIKCRLREITEINTAGAHMEGLDTADAILWVQGEEDIEEGTVVKVDNDYWRVARLVKARRLGDNDIQFKKALVDKHELSGTAEAS